MPVFADNDKNMSKEEILAWRKTNKEDRMVKCKKCKKQFGAVSNHCKVYEQLLTMECPFCRNKQSMEIESYEQIVDERTNERSRIIHFK